MGAAQVPTNVGMPPKDGTPCIAGACRGGFGRADPGQPRCDWPETSTDLERGVVVTGSRRRRAGHVTNVVAAIAYLVASAVTMFYLVTGKTLESCRGVTISHVRLFRSGLRGLASGGLEGWAACRPVAQRPRERKRPRPGTGIPVFRVREKCPYALFFMPCNPSCLRRSC